MALRRVWALYITPAAQAAPCPILLCAPQCRCSSRTCIFQYTSPLLFYSPCPCRISSPLPLSLSSSPTSRPAAALLVYAHLPPSPTCLARVCPVSSPPTRARPVPPPSVSPLSITFTHPIHIFRSSTPPRSPKPSRRRAPRARRAACMPYGSSPQGISGSGECNARTLSGRRSGEAGGAT
ncbi:hypothetical protein B0H14DRAFT_865895 [Mycena olivaceomarginata]|nr:hypothetical protein B0H14DRAFT_865895 [Mycena olivaceomarginata]